MKFNLFNIMNFIGITLMIICLSYLHIYTILISFLSYIFCTGIVILTKIILWEKRKQFSSSLRKYHEFSKLLETLYFQSFFQSTTIYLKSTKSKRKIFSYRKMWSFWLKMVQLEVTLLYYSLYLKYVSDISHVWWALAGNTWTERRVFVN